MEPGPGPPWCWATLRQEKRDKLRDSTGELARDTRALLDDAFTIELRSTAEDPDEQATAQAAYPDQDLTGIGLAEVLAHAPDLLSPPALVAEEPAPSVTGP